MIDNFLFVCVYNYDLYMIKYYGGKEYSRISLDILLLFYLLIVEQCISIDV